MVIVRIKAWIIVMVRVRVIVRVRARSIERIRVRIIVRVSVRIMLRFTVRVIVKGYSSQFAAEMFCYHIILNIWLPNFLNYYPLDYYERDQKTFVQHHR